MQLRPGEAKPDHLFDPHAPTYDMRQADADSDAVPGLFVLRAEDAQTCDWYRQNMADPNHPEYMATRKAQCQAVRVSMAPSGKTALLRVPGAFTEFDIARKTTRELPLPPIARHINCQTVHKGPATVQYLGNNPTDLDRDACNNPTWLPVDPKRLASYPPVDPRQCWMQRPSRYANVSGIAFFSR